MNDPNHRHRRRWIRQACLIEVRSIKPGNVSPTHSFDNASIRDFERSAHLIAPILADAATIGVGISVLQAVTATRAEVGHNTNLGIVLLLAPLAAVSDDSSLRDGIGSVLESLTVADAEAVYEAIRVASPGGLGEADSQDASEPPSINLLECMRLAADRDQIAAEYCSHFQGVLRQGLELLMTTASWTEHADFRIAWIAVSLMARFGDTLIRRKCGEQVETEVRQRAQALLGTGWPFGNADSTNAVFDSFDQFLKADGNRRNPGTTADMIAAITFAALRENLCVADDSERQLIFPDAVHG